MTYKRFITGLLVFSVCIKSFGQHNFDSIKICHAMNGELNNITVGEYEVKINQGQLSSLSSVDQTFDYDADKKLFIVKNLSEGNSYKLQLSGEGVIIVAMDTSFLLSSPKSIGIVNSNGAKDVQTVVYSIRKFSFSLEFKNDKISKIYLLVSGRFITLSLVQIQGKYTWDFGVESANHSNKMILTYAFNKPYLLSIHDDKNKVGIRLMAKKKNGLFSELVGQRIYEDQSFASDNSYKLQYESNGRLKQNNSKFKTGCN
jgi:hypothetical protein